MLSSPSTEEGVGFLLRLASHATSPFAVLDGSCVRESGEQKQKGKKVMCAVAHYPVLQDNGEGAAKVN